MSFSISYLITNTILVKDIQMIVLEKDLFKSYLSRTENICDFISDRLGPPIKTDVRDRFTFLFFLCETHVTRLEEGNRTAT